MPKLNDPVEELKKAKETLQTNPKHKFRAIGHVTGKVWLAVLEAAQKSEKAIQQEVARALSHYYALTSESGICLTLDTPAMTLLQALCRLWATDSAGAVTRLIERAGATVLDQELRNHEGVNRLLK